MSEWGSEGGWEEEWRVSVREGKGRESEGK